MRGAKPSEEGSLPERQNKHPHAGPEEVLLPTILSQVNAKDELAPLLC